VEGHVAGIAEVGDFDPKAISWLSPNIWSIKRIER